MVKIRVFIPHLELKEIFEDVVKKLPQYETIQIEQQYVFGTPDDLAKYGDADVPSHLFLTTINITMKNDSMRIPPAIIIPSTPDGNVCNKSIPSIYSSNILFFFYFII